VKTEARIRIRTLLKKEECFWRWINAIHYIKKYNLEIKQVLSIIEKNITWSLDYVLDTVYILATKIYSKLLKDG